MVEEDDSALKLKMIKLSNLGMINNTDNAQNESYLVKKATKEAPSPSRRGIYHLHGSRSEVNIVTNDKTPI